MRRAVLIADGEREIQFRRRLEEEGLEVKRLCFNEADWMDFDYSEIDLLICWPQFQYSSNHPEALRFVKNNLQFLHSQFPHMKMFPDPALFPYYGDKFMQHLYLKQSGFATPKTMILECEEDAVRAIDTLGVPLVVKNRYGAGGDYVFRVNDAGYLRDLVATSHMRFGSRTGRRFFFRRLFRQRFLRGLLPGRPAEYPFLSPPLLAQEYVPHTRDIKTVVGLGEVVEAHWRERPDGSSWKVNIDGGGLGIWSHVPESVIKLSVDLTSSLGARWLNIDFLFANEKPLISEFSPIWHHYKRDEHENLVYKDDYNLRLPLETALDLELLITTSFTDPRRLFLVDDSE